MARSKLAMVLAACAASFAQAPADPAASVQGVVTNSVTGEPVLHAHVSLRQIPTGPQNGSNQPKRYGALTTGEGKFSISGMGPGRYTIAIDKTGFVTSYENNQLTLQAGDKKEDLKWKIVPTGAISGRVVYPDGTPAVEIAVMSVQGFNGYGLNTRTDENGQYRIGGLTPGKYRLRAMTENAHFPPETRTDGTAEVNYGATYHPGVLLPQEGAAVAVKAGTETGGIDIQMVRTPIIRVSGTVAGLPPGTQNVQLLVRQGRSFSGMGSVNSNGNFTDWRMNPDKYTLQAMWSSPSGQRMMSSAVDIEVRDANIDHLTLQMIAPMDLAGTVIFEDEGAHPQDPSPTAPQAGAGGQAQTRRATLRTIRFSALDGFGQQPVAEMAADGTFHLTGLSASRYRVAPNWGPAYVKSMRIGPTVVSDGVLDLRNGAPGNTLTLVLSSAMGAVSGTVTDDRGPAAAAAVVLVPPDWDVSVPNRYLIAKPDGRYSLGAIPPGSYKIGAVDEADRGMVMDAGNLLDVMEQMESIEVRAGEKLTKDLKLLKP